MKQELIMSTEKKRQRLVNHWEISHASFCCFRIEKRKPQALSEMANKILLSVVLVSAYANGLDSSSGEILTRPEVVSKCLSCFRRKT